MVPPIDAAEKRKEFNTEATEGTEVHRGMRGSHLLESRRYGRRQAVAICGGGCGGRFRDSDAACGCAMVAGFGARCWSGNDASVSGKAGGRTCGSSRGDAAISISVYGGAAARA